LIDETGPLERLFSSRATTRIIDFLVTFREFDYPLTEIAENTGVNRRTVERVMPNLLHYGLVKVTRTVGRSKMYQCNTGSPLVQGVVKVSSEISDHDVKGLLKEEVMMEDRKVERAVPDS
jgi:predicted regulator of amino acid metabolism with ACT domain